MLQARPTSAGQSRAGLEKIRLNVSWSSIPLKSKCSPIFLRKSSLFLFSWVQLMAWVYRKGQVNFFCELQHCPQRFPLLPLMHRAAVKGNQLLPSSVQGEKLLAKWLLGSRTHCYEFKKLDSGEIQHKKGINIFPRPLGPNWDGGQDVCDVCGRLGSVSPDTCWNLV